MPKNIEYPRKSFLDALKVAEAVDYLGGNTLVGNVADKLEIVAASGNFHALIGAATKHDLIQRNRDGVKISELYREIKLAYNAEEKLQALRKAFLTPPVYKKIYEKFLNKEFPAKMLDKILIRELQVQELIASRVANYFIKGATYCELLINNKLVEIGSDEPETDSEDEQTFENSEKGTTIKENLVKNNIIAAPIAHYSSLIESNFYTIHIYGNGIDSRIIVNDDDDLSIVEATLNKLKRKLKEKNKGETAQS